MSTPQPSLEALALSFLTCKQIEGRSPNTLSWYRAILDRFCRYIESTAPGASVEQIGLAEARSFIQQLQCNTLRWQDHPTIKGSHGNLAVTTVRGYVRTLKVFWNWIADEGYIDHSPLLRLRQPRAPRKIIRTFTADEIRAMVASFNLEWPTDYRAYVMVLVFLDTGLRLSELAGLQLNAIDLANSHLRVTGKGSKERVVPFGMHTRRALLHYLQNYRYNPLPHYENHLFTTSSGTPMRPSAIQTMVRRLREQAAITDARCSPHTFRHTFAKNYLLNGGDVFSLQRILGHTSLEIVRMYVNLVDSDVAHLYRAHSPIDHLMAKPKPGMSQQELARLLSEGADILSAPAAFLRERV
jgi:integrase/recombinase XerD